MKITTDNPFLFASRIQSGKTIDELFYQADSRQNELVKKVIESALTLIGDTDGSFSNTINHQSKPSDIEACITSFNEVYGDKIRLVVPQIKTKKRALEKLHSMFNGDSDAAQITDITRLTVIPSTPKIASDFAKALCNRYSHCDTSWRIRPAGLMDRALYVELEKGFISQIQIKEDRQYQAGIDSHVVYEIIRKMIGREQVFDPQHMNDETRKEIQEGYNEVMERMKGTGRITQSPKQQAADFMNDDMYARYKELMLLHQSIHTSALPHSNTEWQTLYTSLALEMNKKLPEGLGIPEYLLPQDLLAQCNLVSGRKV